MKKLSARRRHPLAAFVVLLFALAATGGLYAAFAPAKSAQAEDAPSSLAVEEGKKLFLTGCSSCHGLNGQGTSDGPSLVGVGAAAVDFQVMTGRMPMQQQGPQAPGKPTAYTQAQSDQLGAFIASLGPGPAVPREEEYALDGSLQEGGELFRTNCSQCHNFAGEGGALPEGKFAPALTDVDPKHVYEAMLTGPQNMPSFPDTILPPEQKKSIITYLENTTHEEPNPGGLGLGRIGPVAEGLFVWIFGLGFLIAAAIWIAARTPKARIK